MLGGDGALALCPICKGTGSVRAAAPGTPCGYCAGQGRVPPTLVPQLREAHRLARTTEWVLRAVADWRREVGRSDVR